MPVFFISKDSLDDNRLVVVGPLVQHLRGSLRAKVGELFLFADSNYRRYRVCLDEVSQKRIVGHVVDTLTKPNNNFVRTTLAHALIKPHRMAWMFQKAVELGVNSFIPLITKQTSLQVRVTQYPHLLERWRRIVFEAAQQSERWEIPTILPPTTLDKFLKENSDFDLKLLLWENEKEQRFSKVFRSKTSPANICVLVGPEGGFTDAEIEAAKSHGYYPVTMGSCTLRSETAALASLSVIQAEFG